MNETWEILYLALKTRAWVWICLYKYSKFQVNALLLEDYWRIWPSPCQWRALCWLFSMLLQKIFTKQTAFEMELQSGWRYFTTPESFVFSLCRPLKGYRKKALWHRITSSLTPRPSLWYVVWISVLHIWNKKVLLVLSPHMCHPVNLAPVLAELSRWLFQVESFCVKCYSLHSSRYKATPHTFSITSDYKDKPLPGGKELAATSAAVMAQILSL